MLCWILLNHLSTKVHWCTNKSKVTYLTINTCQVSSVGKASELPFPTQAFIATLPTSENSIETFEFSRNYTELAMLSFCIVL